jgi:Zn-dependent peptidase ImmA (M78 family)
MNTNNIEAQAVKILEAVGINEAADIDVKRIAQYLNVNVQSTTLEADISGLFVIKDNKPYIRYNRDEHEHRWRFTIAHELGHFLLHKDVPLFVDRKEKIFFRNTQSATGEVMRERQANAFAAALLMPKHFIEQELGNVPSNKEPVSHLAKVFNVSMMAMSFRLSNLGYDFGLF